MCLGVPGKVIKINGKSCSIDLMGVNREVSIELLENVKVGDYLLVHAGCAIQVLNQEEAQQSLDIFNELRDIMNG